MFPQLRTKIQDAVGKLEGVLVSGWISFDSSVSFVTMRCACSFISLLSNHLRIASFIRSKRVSRR